MTTTSPKDDAVSVNSQWRERIKKELRGLSINENFRLTEKTCQYLPEKPCNVPPPASMSTSRIQIPQPESRRRARPQSASVAETLRRQQELRDSIAERAKPPFERYDQPVTSANEIGWYHRPLVTQRNHRNYRPLSSCEITSYASNVLASQGVSPFARKPEAPAQT
eukprot:CAMPEP_0114560466 /NCGR_PEP_ID=MMETSP0114-20121206/11476_1 /TAXON_ID=31324 /ORGANISM="Goniomonas sp, Strain m" /LENGTH=165 /DNA_ID=CAMNT_0001746017 /DNA_START=54 /DNA_END=551 /DNA_ORIENTATION=+